MHKHFRFPERLKKVCLFLKNLNWDLIYLANRYHYDDDNITKNFEKGFIERLVKLLTFTLYIDGRLDGIKETFLNAPKLDILHST